MRSMSFSFASIAFSVTLLSIVVLTYGSARAQFTDCNFDPKSPSLESAQASFGSLDYDCALDEVEYFLRTKAVSKWERASAHILIAAIKFGERQGRSEDAFSELLQAFQIEPRWDGDLPLDSEEFSCMMNEARSVVLLNILSEIEAGALDSAESTTRQSSNVYPTGLLRIAGGYAYGLGALAESGGTGNESQLCAAASILLDLNQHWSAGLQLNVQRIRHETRYFSYWDDRYRTVSSEQFETLTGVFAVVERNLTSSPDFSFSALAGTGCIFDRVNIFESRDNDIGLALGARMWRKIHEHLGLGAGLQGNVSLTNSAKRPLYIQFFLELNFFN